MSQNFNELPDVDYSADSFGTPGYGQPPARKRSGCFSSTPLLIFGGCGALLAVACLCCVGLLFVGARQPSGAVLMWGIGAQADWGFAENFVCDGSQAERLTQQYRQRGVQFTSSFNAVQETGNSNRVNVDSSYTEDGETVTWEATFITKSSGGFIGNCIDEIDVTREE